MHLISVIVFALITIVLVVITRSYHSLPAIEFKRRARQGDAVSKKLWSVAAYGISSQVLLWFLIGLSAAGFFVSISHNDPVWASLTGSVALIWVGFVWLPNTSLNRVGEKLAVLLAPAIAWVLRYVHPVAHHADRFKSKDYHTGIYEKADLYELLERQERQTDNRVHQVEIDMIRHVLSFNDQIVSDIMIPRKKVVSVEAGDLLGPIVLDELHKSGYTNFPVYSKGNKDIIGTFNLGNITKTPQEGVKVSSLMEEDVISVNEEDHLSDVLKVILKTNKRLLRVVNNFDEYVGIITTKDVFSELTGHLVSEEISGAEDTAEIVDEFEKDGLEIAEATNSDSTELLK